MHKGGTGTRWVPTRMGLRARISSRDGVISNLVSRNLQPKNVSQEIDMFGLPTMTQDDKQVQFDILFSGWCWLQKDIYTNRIVPTIDCRAQSNKGSGTKAPTCMPKPGPPKCWGPKEADPSKDQEAVLNSLALLFLVWNCSHCVFADL